MAIDLMFMLPKFGKTVLSYFYEKNMSPAAVILISYLISQYYSYYLVD